jgi:hypothetical protein
MNETVVPGAVQISEKAYQNYEQYGVAADSTNQEFMQCLPPLPILLEDKFAGRDFGCSLAAASSGGHSLAPPGSANQTVNTISKEQSSDADRQEEGGEAQGRHGPNTALLAGGLGGACSTPCVCSTVQGRVLRVNSER